MFEELLSNSGSAVSTHAVYFLPLAEPSSDGRTFVMFSKKNFLYEFVNLVVSLNHLLRFCVFMVFLQSLTTLRGIEGKDFSFIGSLSQLRVLELGNCLHWTKEVGVHFLSGFVFQ